ncbi:hypothetical protein [Ornithinimicrobium faecis]|uniref:PH domain-containing protein n=1 Tax=Ornithinimicrobium faecis TaxID=2934158 RepID=A0ABY4YR48_9MICO|nr:MULTISPECIES: hypothetical protein [unclassified Ornithinimicrobium]USQ78755.1 hypothetical protein NF556_14110 [Ornithinimicrobium sp. HY1793]
MAAPESQTYRTLPARIVGWVILVAVAGLAVVMGSVEVRLGNNPLSPAAFLGVVAAIVWVVLLRPSVRLESDRVAMSNLVTDVVVPFERLAAVKRQWALELIDNAGTKHSSWAIPVRRELRPRKDIDSYAEATTKGKAREGNNAEVVAGHVEKQWQRWKLDGGVAEPGQGVHRTWALGALVPLAAAIVFLVVVLLVG